MTHAQYELAKASALRGYSTMPGDLTCGRAAATPAVFTKEDANMPMNNDARTQWNAKQYTQVKVYVSPDLAKGFKAACISRGESMAAVISQAMLGYCDKKPAARVGTKATVSDYTTRGKRRIALRYHTEQVEAIRNAEETYKENIPETLQAGQRYDDAGQTVEALDEAIDALSRAFV